MALEPELEPAACGRRENHLAHNVANANGINNAGFPAGEDDQPSRLPDPPHSVPIRRRKVWHGYSRVWTTAVGRILGGKIQFVIKSYVRRSGEGSNHADDVAPLAEAASDSETTYSPILRGTASLSLPLRTLLLRKSLHWNHSTHYQVFIIKFLT